jgi:hypothetical protein
MTVLDRHAWTVQRLARLTPEQRRELRDQLARQERSKDAQHREAACGVLDKLRQADANTADKRVADARAFLYGQQDTAKERRAEAARSFLYGERR